MNAEPESEGGERHAMKRSVASGRVWLIAGAARRLWEYNIAIGGTLNLVNMNLDLSVARRRIAGGA